MHMQHQLLSVSAHSQPGKTHLEFWIDMISVCSYFGITHIADSVPSGIIMKIIDALDLNHN